MKVVYMGTPDFAVPPVETLYNEGFDIPLVITQKDRPRGRGKKLQPTAVKKKAIELGLEVYQPDNINSSESVEVLEKIAPDVIVVTAYGQILKREILSMPKYGCINIHASLLPKYRGAAPINWAIINGEEKTGITIMEMEEGLDSGPMLLQSSIEIKEDDDAQKIHDRLSYLGSRAIIQVLREISEGSIKKQLQDDSKATYASKITKDLGKIDWEDRGKDIKNMIRGLKPWPSAYTDYEGKSMKIHNADVIDKFIKGENGKVVKVSKDGIYVNCSDNCIVVKEIQMPGKRKLSVDEYLRGNKFKSDIILS